VKDRYVCDAQEHATEAEYQACPICNPPFMTDAQMLEDVEGRLDYRRAEAESLREQLEQAEQEIGRLKYAYSATNKVLDSQGQTLKIALDYLRKIGALAREVDEIFNLSEQDYPGDTE